MASSTAVFEEVEGFIPADAAARRRSRGRAARFIRSSSSRAGARGCMVEPREGVVRLRNDGTTGRSHLSGVKRCGSPWSCQSCSPKVRQRKAERINAVVAAALAEGHTVLFTSATLPHTRADCLADLMVMVQSCWSEMWQGGWSDRFRKRWGMMRCSSVHAVRASI